MKDFNDFKFEGRSEFFNPPLNMLSVYPLIVEAYRKGFVRGCRAGAEDVIRYLEIPDEDHKIWNTLLDCQEHMSSAIPSYDRETVTVTTKCDVQPITSLDWKK